MSKFKNLIDGLKAKHIVIIENEITNLDTTEDIIGSIILMLEGNRNRLIIDLERNDHQKLSRLLQSFIKSFTKNDLHPEHIDILPGDPTFYIKKYVPNNDGLLFRLNILSAEINSKLDNQDFHKILSRNGIIYTIANHYNPILSALNAREDVIVSYYKQAPAFAQFEDFSLFIKEQQLASGSNFTIAIVDKLLEDNGENIGSDFLRDFIKDKPDSNLLGIVFTSDPKDKIPSSYQQYFLREVSKADENVLNTITDKLTYAAYALSFHFIHKSYMSGSTRALETVLMNQRNISNILDHGHKEGIPPFKMMNYWYKSAMDYITSEKFTEGFNFNSGLSSLFNFSSFDPHPEEIMIHDLLSNIDAFETFDIHINKRFSPVAPGDIFKIKDDYYVLIGQACDTMLRHNSTSPSKNNKRGAKIAELYKATISENSSKHTNKKFQLSGSGVRKIQLENFSLTNNPLKFTLDLEISSSRVFYADFKVLDLCMYNENGVCYIDTSNHPTKNILNSLPRDKEKYFNELVSQFQEREHIKKSIRMKISSTSNLLVNGWDYRGGKEKMYFGVKRISRIREKFLASLNNAVLTYKGRIDLNFTDFAEEVSNSEIVKYKFGYDDAKNYKEIEIPLWSGRKSKYFKLSDLVDNLPNEFKPILEMINSEGVIVGKEEFYELKFNSTHYLLDFNTFNTINNKIIGRRGVKLVEIIPDIKQKVVKFADTLEVVSLENEKGHPILLKHTQLIRGLKIESMKLIVILQNGILTQESYE